MTIKEIVKNIDISNNNDQWIDFETVGQDLNLSWEEIEDIDGNKNNLFRSEYISCHMCTDTFVGLEAFFLEGELVCLTHQSARKSEKQVVGWVSKDLAEKTKEYLKSLSTKVEKGLDIEILDLKEDLGVGYKVQYSNELMHRNVNYENELHKVISSPSKDQHGEYNFHEIVIERDGKEKRVDVRDLEVPYMLGDKFNKYSLR